MTEEIRLRTDRGVPPIERQAPGGEVADEIRRRLTRRALWRDVPPRSS
jgi:hypothetical protein